MSATKFTNTPSPIEVVEKVNAIIYNSGYWEPGEAVSVGDIRFVPGRENSGYVFECIQAGTTGSTVPEVSEDDIDPEATPVTNINELEGVLGINKGGTGATTASGALNNLGITATSTELNYVEGVTSNIQAQLNNKLSTSGTAAKATADANGNNIANTYATKTELSGKANVNSSGHLTFSDGSEFWIA